MDELDKKAQKGLEAFGKQGDIGSVKSALDGLVDDMLGDDDEIIQENPPKRFKWYYIAAAVIGLCIIGYIGFKDGKDQSKVQSPPAIYAQYFEVLPDMDAAGERGNDTSEIKSDAVLGMQLYSQKKYAEAAQILRDEPDPQYLVYAGIAEMENDAYDSAIQLLTESKSLDKSDVYSDIISWYLALSHLKQGDLDKAKTEFTTIANSKHYKKNEATEILKLLK